ncbi:MAG TPA: ABC transporter ATP-binding protein [Chloroflexota bacterium]|jgi:ABC-type multidrug transport system fused ATPase/permease subunit
MRTKLASRRRPLSPAVSGTLAVLRLLPRVSRPLTLLLAGGTLAQAVLPLAITVVTGLLVGAVPAALADGAGSDAAGGLVGWLGLAALLIGVVRVLGPLQTALASAFARQVDRHLQERAMAAVGRPSGVAHLEDPETLDLIRNAQGVGTEGLHPGDAVKALATLLPSWLQALGSALILIGFSPWLGLAWLVMWPLVLYVLQREFVRVGEAGAGQAAAVRRSDYLRDLALTPPAAKELRVWGMVDWLLKGFDAAWLQAMAPVWRTRRPGRPVIWLTAGAVTALNLVGFGLLAWAAVRGDLGLAALAVYSRAALEASMFRAFDDPNSHLAYAAVSVPALLELERRLAEGGPGGPDEVGSGPSTASRSGRPGGEPGLPPEAPREGIRFEGVTFRYPGRGADVLAGLDLFVPAGRSLAIVGANGAGKTTLIKLLCRLYDPSEGRVAVDGVDLREVDPRAWRRRVAAIFQDFVQYHLSARANVALGAPELAADAGRLRAAAEKAGALDLIESLPRGWDTVLARQYTGGIDLSGGQWQRIALARALLALEGGARVLILDEPTANLDVRAEAALYDRFLDITAGLTTILISHRFSTVRRADRIVVLEAGRVVEDGTHDGLIALDGRYATMFRLQAARFADEPEVAEPALAAEAGS